MTKKNYRIFQKDCFSSLKRTVENNERNNVRWGCYTATTATGCGCTVDSTYIPFTYIQTFNEALDNIRRATSNFASREAERHEGYVYLTYTCPRSGTNFPQVISNGSDCSGKGNSAESLRFTAGDVIFCQLRSNPFGFHVLLATSDSTVAHVEGDEDRASLREDRWKHVICSFDVCTVKSDGDFCGSSFNPFGLTQAQCKYSADESVQRARKDIKEKNQGNVYYDLFQCNCEHWVRRWKDGVAFSNQAVIAAIKTGHWGTANSYCQAN